MKKFLSLVLALVMTMSLVTISAGATEYKDLKDKNEIKYAEAVAVMNKIGIISGYEDGNFKPTGTLTRGAAAKIVTYMMLGTVAAEQLGVAGKPYKDVALDNTFAPYIAYCKSTGLINGFSDGTFRSGAPLDGYSYSKMLLTAMGYRSANEGFTGSGWQTKVASLAVKSGLYTGNDGFIGSAIVTREEACLYALNLMESVTVEYLGQPNTIVTPDGTKVETGYQPASKVKMDNETTSHDYNGRNKDNGAGYVEFCEVHYPQLKLTATGATDDFERPSNQWAYKNAIIGTYAVDADFTFTKGTGDDGENADYNAKEFGLKGYHFGDDKDAGVTASINGSTVTKTVVKNCQDLAKLTGNGTVIELFLDSKNPNVITSVVVIKTQLMQINSINSSAKTVTLKQVESTGSAVNTVKEDDAGYAVLSAMKADDYVLITPVETSTSGVYTVAEAVAPTVATGKLSKVTTKSNGTTVKGITVAGTDYAMSANWTAKGGQTELKASSVSTKNDTTVYVDSFGFAIYVKDFTAATSYILYDDTYSTIVDGKIHYYANGYDMNGDALSLDFGTTAPGGTLVPGTTYAYIASTANGGEYAKDTTNAKIKSTTTASIAAGATNLVDANGTYYFASGVKFIFANVVAGSPADLDGITVKDGVQAVAAGNMAGLQFVVDDKGAITTVIVANDKDVEVSKNVLYISSYDGSATLGNKTVGRFTAYIEGVKTENCVATKALDATAKNQFYTFSVNADGNYDLNTYAQTGKTTSVLSNVVFANTAANIQNKTYILKATDATGTPVADLNAKNAVVIDLTSPTNNINSFKDLVEKNANANYTVSMVFNNSTTGNGKGTVSYMFVLNATGVAATQLYVADAAAADVTFYTDAACTAGKEVLTRANAADDVYTKFMTGDKLYAKGNADLDAVAVTGGTVKALDRATASTSKPIYEITLTGNITAATGTTGWATATVTAGTVNTQADFKGDVITTGKYVAFGETLYAKGTALQNVTISGGTGATTKLYSARPTVSADIPVYELKVGTATPTINVANGWALATTVGTIATTTGTAPQGTYAATITTPFTYVTGGDKLTVAVTATRLPVISDSVALSTGGTAPVVFTKDDVANSTVKNIEFTVAATPIAPTLSVTQGTREFTSAALTGTGASKYTLSYQIGDGPILTAKPDYVPADQEIKVILTANARIQLDKTAAGTITVSGSTSTGITSTVDRNLIGGTTATVFTYAQTVGAFGSFGDTITFYFAPGTVALAPSFACVLPA